MPRNAYSKFLKGINARFNPKNQDDPTRLFTLQNARLQSRGETMQVSRIKGFQIMANSPIILGTVFDTIMYADQIIVLSYSAGSVHIDIFNITTETVVISFSFADTEYASAKLILQEDTIFITGYNKMLNFIGGTWYLNEFVSTTPTIQVSSGAIGSRSVGSITITGAASPENDPVAATSDPVSVVSTAPSSSGNVDVIYDGVTVTIGVLSTDTVDQAATKIVNGVNADGTIGVTAVVVSSNSFYFEAKTAGAVENGKDVTLSDAGTTGIIFNSSSGNEVYLMQGGSDGNIGTEGNLIFSINGEVELSYAVQYGDTKVNIATGLLNYLTANSLLYSGTLDTGGANPIINIVADNPGPEYDGVIVEDENSTAVTYTKIDLSGGAYELGNLKQDTDYWYKVRYVYHDNHKTKTSYPVHFNTGNNQGIIIQINVTQDDLDDGWIDIEIFRKRDTEEFFLIDRVTPDATSFIYTDDGKPNLSGFTEQAYIWTDHHKTGEMVRDRLVFANTEYPGVENNSEWNMGLFPETIETGEQAIPPNMEVQLFSKIRKPDGIETISKFHGSVNTIQGSEHKIHIQQTAIHPDPIKEIATFAKFVPLQEVETIPFKSVEIYNANVPSIATVDDPEVDQDRPANPHIFLGHKYVMGDSFDTDRAIVFDAEWNTNEQPEDGSANLYQLQNAVNYNNDLTIFSFFENGPYASDLPYSKLAFRSGSTDEKIYRIAFYDALKEAISQGKAKLKLTGINGIDGPLSSSAALSDFLGAEVQIIGLTDTSFESPNQIFEYGINDNIAHANYNHLYLVLESGSVFDEFDNIGANNIDVRGDYEAPGGAPASREHRFEFEIIGLDQIDNGVTSSVVVNNHTEYEYEYRLRLTDYTDFQNDAGIFLYSRTTQSDTEPLFIPDIQGWEKTLLNGFEFYEFNDWNIVTFITTEEDIEDFNDDYPTQLIWSEPFLLGTGVNGLRNFRYTNFKSISQNYGEILDIQYIGNFLLAFCERGVNLINVGETLTQQPSGDAFVSSATFLTGDRWILKHVPGIQIKSIVQYEDTLFFCDGRDVWQYSGGRVLGPENNITNGRIVLDGDIKSAVIDPDNKEYRITDQSQTWAYSIELGEWMGPYTYVQDDGSTYQNKLFSIIDGAIKEHNQGNTFDGQEFDSHIESVALDLETPAGDKLWRKLLIEIDGDDFLPTETTAGTGMITTTLISPTVTGVDTDFVTEVSIGDELYNDNYELIGTVSSITDATTLVLDANALIAVNDGDWHYGNITKETIFEYGKDFDVKNSKNVFTLAKKLGLHHIGVTANDQNSVRMFWGIRTNVDGFVLRTLGFQLKPRNRT